MSSFDTLFTSLEESAAAPAAVELAKLSGITAGDRDRFIDVWRRLSIQQRRNIIDRLTEMSEDNAEFDFSAVYLLGVLDDDVQVRADSIKALWEYEGDDLIGVLLRLLRDPEAIVRAEAALGLGRFLFRAELTGDSAARIGEIENALRLAATDTAELPEVRGRAIEAIGVRGHEWVRDLIEDAYASGERRLRISAIHAMGRNADLDWLPNVIEEMNSDDPEARFEAATAAGEIADEEAIPDLARLAGDDDPEVQEAAIAALGQIGGPRARDLLHTLASEATDERVLEAVSAALSEADFFEDPLGIRVELERSVAEDMEEADEE